MHSDSLISKHLSIKIGLWLIIIFMMVAVFGWDILNDMKRLRFEANIVEKSNHKSHDLHSLEININRYIDPVKEFLITGDYRLEAYFYQLHTRLFSAIKAYESNYPESKLMDVLEDMDQIRALSHKIFILPFAVGNMEGPILLQEVNERARFAVSQLAKQHQDLDIQVNSAMHMMNGLRMDMHDEAMALLIALLITLLFLTHFIYGQIVLPLVRMRKAVQYIGEGDLTQQCLITSSDEIGELATAFNAMSRALQERDKKLDHARSLAAYHDKMNALGLMAGGIAHEVGNPLAAISVSLHVAQRKIVSNNGEAIQSHLQIALNEVARMESIIQVILDFGRHEPDQQMSYFHLKSVVDNAIHLAQMSPDKKTVSVQTKTSDFIPKVYADEGMLLQVLINLIINSMDACVGGGDVKIRIFEEKKGVVIVVKDTGCGISADVQQDIFSPHFTSKARGKGTGLGLAISRELMHSMEGSLELLSSDTTGSCFQIWLPTKGNV